MNPADEHARLEIADEPPPGSLETGSLETPIRPVRLDEAGAGRTPFRPPNAWGTRRVPWGLPPETALIGTAPTGQHRSPVPLAGGGRGEGPHPSDVRRGGLTDQGPPMGHGIGFIGIRVFGMTDPAPAVIASRRGRCAPPAMPPSTPRQQRPHRPVVGRASRPGKPAPIDGPLITRRTGLRPGPWGPNPA